MKPFALALLSIWLALPASAQTVDALSRVEINTFTASNANRTLALCLLADTQNAVSSDNAEQTPNAATDCSLASSCTGASCIASPYCSGSWHNTGRILMQNLAYELTGQWEKIDYSAIDGNDNVRSKKPHPLDNSRCDAILSLGDMTDVPSGTDLGYGDYEEASAATLTSLGYDYQHETNKAFWRIIDESGIPYVLNQGNHDPWVWWADLFTTFNIEGKSYFHEREPTFGLSYAVLIPTRLGKPLCVISYAFSDQYHDTDAYPTRESDNYAWVASVTGCGGNYPTVFVGHYALVASGVPGNSGAAPAFAQLTGGYYALPGVAGASEIFMGAGGHDYPVATKSNFTGLFGADADALVYTFMSNWQETNRHDSNDSGLGVTTSDGNGGAYTVVMIDANASRICGHDWSPYWQARSSRANGQNHGAEQMSSICFDFNFDARFP